MWPEHKKRLLPWLTGLVVLALFSLTGCVEVQVIDTTPDALTSPLPAPNGKHNLAVLAVDFDPPLSYQQLTVYRQGVELLVAIENSGSVTERDVAVRAWLSSPEDPDFVLSQEAALKEIAPGEVQIVRFSRLTEIPYHQTFRLEVAVDALDGESDYGDNQKAFDIQISRE